MGGLRPSFGDALLGQHLAQPGMLIVHVPSPSYSSARLAVAGSLSMVLGPAAGIRHLPYANAHQFPIFGCWLLTGAVSLRPVTRDNPGEMGGRLQSLAFVGRVEELQTLEAARRRAADAEPAVVLVGGEAGVGKTRLVAELAARCAADGMRVLVGGCVPVGGDGLPYAPIVEALRALPDELGLDTVRELAGPSWRELARLLPILGEPKPGPAGSAAQARLFELLLGLLGRLSEQTPIALVVEDLHWSDQSTRDLLAFLVRNLRQNRVLVVVTYRSDEPHSDQLGPWLAELDRGGPVERLHLARLDWAETAAQLVGILGAAPPADLVDAVFGRSEGNPFFTEELLAAVRAGSSELPATVRDLLRGRVQVLPERAQQVLAVAAVAGQRVPHRLLASVVGLDDRDLLEALRVVVAHQLLVARLEEDGYQFRHALLQEVVEADLLPGERARLHAAYAQALTERPELAGVSSAVRAAELAIHWEAAGEATQALPARVQAGLAAERARAFAEADRHYQRALALWEQVADPGRPAGLDWVDLLTRAAEAAGFTGTTDRAVELLEQALDQMDQAREPVRAAILLRLLGGHRHTALDHGAALAAYTQAEQLLAAEAPSAERARVLADHAHGLLEAGRPREAVPRCEDAIAVARLVGAIAEEARALVVLASCLDDPAELDRSIALHLEARQLAEEAGDAQTVIDTYGELAFTLARAGRDRDALADARNGYQRARQLGLEHAVGSYVAYNLAWQLLAAGQWAECERFTADLLAVDSWAAHDLHAVRAQLLTRQGSFAAAHEQLDQVDRVSHGRDLAWLERAELALWESDNEAASAVAAEGPRWRRSIYGPDGGLSHHSSQFYPLALRLAADQAERAAGRRAADELAEIRRRTEPIVSELDQLTTSPPPEARHPGVLCNLLLAKAELSRLEGASDPERWQTAATAWERLERPFEVAYTRFRQAEALLARGASREQAEVALRPAHHTAVALGAAPLRREIERLAQRGRLRLQQPVDEALAPKAASPAASLGLTQREAEVLALVAEGRTNRQIGQALFITPKTAGVHVSRILAKLGVAGRGEAAAIAHRLGLDKQ
jgi:DNA-binding CsgD family transcriptional regulator